MGAPRDGTAYVKDKLTVHIFFSNIADGSDAFAYVKAHICKDDGRFDVKAIRV